MVQIYVDHQTFAIVASARLPTPHETGGNVDMVPRTDLDSHANMPVVGHNAHILSHSGLKADVRPYSPDYGPMEIEIVDAAIYHECIDTGRGCIFVIRNALYVPSMVNNLIPPFIMQEKGIQVRDTPKINVNDPEPADHAIVFPETGLRIPMHLWGTSHILTRESPACQNWKG